MTGRVEIGSTVGGYTIESQLGRGGMSVVYVAEDAKLGRKVALKVMAEELSENEAFRNRFIREAKMAANLEHPSIVPVYDAGEAEGVLYLAMRVIRGTDLRREISAGGPIAPDRTVAILRQVASALDAAHRAGLVHRDVKPGNVLLASEGDDEHAYLTDFGLTKHVSSKSGLTKTGTFMGTIDYVAPEQIRGDEVDGRTDQYSLACVLYECLTADVPFAKDTDVAILFAHLEDDRPLVTSKVPGLPAAIDDVIGRAMARTRDDRFPTCTAFMLAARDALTKAPAVSTPAPTMIAPPPTSLAPPPPQPGAAPVEDENVLAESHPSFPPTEQPPIAATAPAAPSVGGPAHASAAAGGPERRAAARRRTTVLLGVAALAVIAIVVSVIILVGGGEPEPPPTPPAPTGPSPPTTISNANAITIPKAGPGTPYPSAIEVSDMRGVVTDVNVTLDGFSHGFPSDVDVLLVGPDGHAVGLMQGVGGFDSVTGLTLTFDDQGQAMNESRLVTSGTYRPSNAARPGFGFQGPPPAPSPPSARAWPSSTARTPTARGSCSCSTTPTATAGRSPADGRCTWRWVRAPGTQVRPARPG